jgi:hypothetical protein
MLDRRTFLLAAAASTGYSLPARAAEKETPPAPGFLTRGLPGPGQDSLKVLAGQWRAEVTLYMAFGSPAHPVASTAIVTTRQWIDGGRYLQDITKGSIAGGEYWRLGLLGYDNMASRYQWVTLDPINADMMIYQGSRGSGPHYPINMMGSFVDQGVLGEAYAGKVIRQRTEIIVDSPDKHIFNIYFTPPGERERLADHNVYTRVT